MGVQPILSNGPARHTSWALDVLVALMPLITGCSENEVGPWKEEVRLSDGRLIVVERFEDMDVLNPMGDVGAAFVNEATLKIISPTELADIPELEMPYRPVILDYDAKEQLWFAIGVNDDACGGEAFHSGHMDASGTINLRPNFEYRLVDGEWTSIAIGPERLGLAANLLIDRTTIEQFDVMPLAEKVQLGKDTGLPREYRKIQPHIGCG